MRKYNIISISILLMISSMAMAQKYNTIAKKKQKVANIEETTAQRLYNNMLQSTAKVMFIDSIIVDKNDFVKQIPLNHESGKITCYNDFFKTDKYPNSFVYQNEFGNRCYYSKCDTVYGRQIYTIDKLGDDWTKPQPLNGIGDEFIEPNYPFMMADGITLFFSAKGKNSIGGYDIFMTLFDNDTKKFYKPENYGLPFNSTANDYLLVYDELDTLGWLVSDRYQPEGKVCIYTFVPTYPRMGFGHDNITEQQLDGYAKLSCIKNTWKYGDRNSAMDRLHQMMQSSSQKQDNKSISFIINDTITYHSIDDFRSPTDRHLFLELLNMKNTLNKNEQKFDNHRIEYHNSSSHIQQEMINELLMAEKEIEQQKTNIVNMEKKIRNTENLLTIN